MTKQEFAQLHRDASPLVLFNIWDAGSAIAVARAGAKALATGSHSLAGAQGYDDGEAIGLDRLLDTVRQIAAATDLPLTVDFEAGFSPEIEGLSANTSDLVEAGAIGCNLEDQLFGQSEIRAADEQAARIAAVDQAGLFVNARTDTFLSPLRAGEDPNQQHLVAEAISRGHAYANAGAGSFFIPGLSNPDMIAQVCEEVTIPINVMRLPGMIGNHELAALGVARISYGGAPWADAMVALEEAARAAFQ